MSSSNLALAAVCCFIALFASSLADEAPVHHITALGSLDDLKFDGNNRLTQHYLVFRGGDGRCRNNVVEATKRAQPEYRVVGEASGSLAALLFAEADTASSGNCSVMCINRGSMRDFVQHVIPEKRHDGKDVTTLQQFISERCQRAEFGFINWTPHNLVIYWINTDGERVKVGDLLQKEVNTQWQTTILGHKFEVVDETGPEEIIIRSFTVEYDAFNVLGDAGSRVIDRHNVTREVQETLAMEWHRHNRVTRSFTEVGFNKGRMPDDLWNSMSSYYYNNRFSKVREEWDSKGLYVNWWDVNAYMIGMPWGLKTYWQSRLKLLVEAWSGTELELTDIYGMRRYEDGARLLTHVDREATHAASLIINVAQGDIREPWPVEIYDHANRLHEVIMQEGDIVYYESAKCLHGRMKPLRGSHYVNLFAHYRPVGDPQWFIRSNPEGTPPPLVDIAGREADLPFLSKSTDVPNTLLGPDSLMQHWRGVEPSEDEMFKVTQWHQKELERLRFAREQERGHDEL